MFNKMLGKIRSTIQKTLLTTVFPGRDSFMVKRIVESIYPLGWTNEQVKQLIKFLSRTNIRSLTQPQLAAVTKVIETTIKAQPLEEEHPYYLFRYFGQDGEDILLSSLLDVKSPGFYVDVGAHHPFRFSNTYYFNKRGWRGINIDPTPGFKELFDEKRPTDINLEIGIGSTPGSLKLYEFEDTALNTFSEERAKSIQDAGRFEITGEKDVPVKTLEQVLDEHLDGNQIDFLTIDVEKQELDVLKSNNWKKYSPKIMLVEISDLDLENPDASEVHVYLKNLGYKLTGKTLRTCFYELQT